jgi:hypothetical protein
LDKGSSRLLWSLSIKLVIKAENIDLIDYCNIVKNEVRTDFVPLNFDGKNSERTL